MRSLFTKILLWFLAAMLITTIGFVIILTHNFTSARGRQHLFGRMAAFQLEEARHAYQTGGQKALAEYLGRFSQFFDAQGVLTDGNFRDLLTRMDRRDLYEKSEQQTHFFQAPVIARASSDGRYWFFMQPQHGRPGFTFFPPQYLWIVAAIVVLALFVALHLTAPVRKLHRAVERFGKGDLAARVKPTRRDELGRLGRAFDQMADRTQTLLQAERRLLLDISHELRSPLARLSVAVELARSPEEESREAALARIEKEAERLNTLVGELLQVTRAEGDPNLLRHEPVRVDQLVADLVDDCSVEAQARGCRLELHPASPITVQGDPELLRRAIENVVRNAIRHTAPDTAVEVDLSRLNGTARVRVRDHGAGVAIEHLSRIFDPFYRVESDRDRSSGGVGLGLSIARRAIDLHKGTIRARNASPGLEVDIDVPAS